MGNDLDCDSQSDPVTDSVGVIVTYQMHGVKLHPSRVAFLFQSNLFKMHLRCVRSVFIMHMPIIENLLWCLMFERLSLSLPLFLLQALDDFKARINMYEKVYEPITNRNLHYIKLIDM